MGWTCRCILWFFAVLLSLAAAESSAEEAQRVLLLQSFGQHFSPFNSFTGQFRAGLASRSPGPLDIYEVSLETARFADDAKDDPFVNYLTALFAERRPDLVVTIGSPAARFAQAHRHRLFPSTPMLVTALDERRLLADSVTANDAVVAIKLNPSGVVENVLQVLPETTKVFVVLGNSPLETFWRQETAKAFKQFEGRLSFEWSNELPFDEILDRAAALPSGAVVLFALMAVDAEGVPFEEDRALARLHAAASVPVFGVFDSQLGKGIVGGPLMHVDDVASEAASAALRILGGESPAGIKVPALGPGVPVFDMRELNRWDISEARLPPGSKILFREPTIWDLYRWQIMAVAALCLVEAGLIFGLLANRRRLKRAQSALLQSEERLSLAASAANLALWVWDIARNEIWVTESGRKFFGWSPSDSVSFENFVEAAHPDDRASFRRAVRRALAGKGDFQIEYRLEMAASDLRWVASRGQVEFADGKPTRTRGVTIDVTERREAEEAAHDLSGRLIHAHEEERSRLARELHDDVTQRLAVLAIDASRGERNALTPADGSAMRELRQGLVRLSEDVHALSYRLHPSILEDLGLAEALQAECDTFSRAESIAVEVEIGNVPEELPHPVALCLFRVAQEALRNVARHAEASSARISIWHQDHQVHLSVTDDGKGFDPKRQRSRPSLGLASMRQRVELLGGELNVESATDHGTKVRAWVPLQEEVRGPTTHIAG